MTINLRHEECGGWYRHFSERIGLQQHGFKCEKCGDIMYVQGGDEESRAREETERVKSEARIEEAIKNYTPPEPKRKLSLMEALKLTAYRGWSEDLYAAGFLSFSEGWDGFKEQMTDTYIYEDYEEELLRKLEDWP